ncbi:hypothetical protein [uncultured Lutibacter sp.]|uniref:hypothetical protein n=1 Tax=uncultured Lutibacter sp. TaxID=437739 RepID=UPI002610F660|nr:hypothetical protein [uncultured Lutibacter sp.]
MRKLLFLLIIVSSLNNLWSQNNYKIDSIVSVSIPGDAIKIDSISNNKTIIQFQSKVENSEFIVKKEFAENDSISIYKSNLPYDLKSLETYYKSLTKTYLQNSPFKLESEKLIEKDSLQAYHLTLKDSLKESTYEIEYFIVNNYIYLFECKTSGALQNDEKTAFFNSINIKYDQKLDQFMGKTEVEKTAFNLGYKLGYTIKKHPSYIWISLGAIAILIIGIIVFFVRKK